MADSIGSRIRDIRQSNALSLAEVASQAGVSVATLSRIETGKQSLGIDLLLRLAKILQTSPADLVSSGGRPEVGSLSEQVASLPQNERLRFWREFRSASRQRRMAVRRPRPEQQVEELLAQIECVRDAIDDVRRKLRTRR